MTDDLRADYEEAGFSKRLGFGERPALIVVDFCNAYLDPDSPLYAGVEDALASTERILAGARAAGIPILFTEVQYDEGGADGGVFFRKVDALKSFVRGNPLADFPESLAPRSGEIVITKQYASAFFGTSLASTLTALGVDSLIVTGVSTSGCVRATAVDACQHGFVPLVVREAVGDRSDEVHEANLFDLDAKYADVVAESDVLAHLGDR
ncbi:MAG: N-carbamoylsarcosine amidohydrolase [Acidimicrobiia bacterium]